MLNDFNPIIWKAAASGFLGSGQQLFADGKDVLSIALAFNVVNGGRQWR